MAYILILYYSRDGSTRALAQHVARGVEMAGEFEARLRTVPEISPTTEAVSASIPEAGAPYVTIDDLAHCSGLALGSPTRFGQMASPLRYFLDQTSSLWVAGTLIDKPACVFSSSSSLHGGQESTLLNMMVPLFHHGMMVMGVPYTDDGLYDTKAGGTPYGATHVAGKDQSTKLDRIEQGIAQRQGLRLAKCAMKQGVSSD